MTTAPHLRDEFVTNKTRDAVRAAMRSKTAGFPPFSKNGPPPSVGGDAIKRDIPKDHPFNPRALKPMSKALWASTVALGHALAAYREFSRLKSASVSPDGLMGGRGYMMDVRDIRQKLFEATESLSAISDTLYDEINAPHWKPKLAQLNHDDKEDVGRFIERSIEFLRSPEDEATEEMDEIEAENDAESPRSELPDGGHSKQASRRSFSAAVEDLTERIFQAIESGCEPQPVVRDFLKTYMASSSLPVESLPGPRVDHLGPGQGGGPWGSYNDDEEPVDRADTTEDDYVYEWENELKRASSGLPQDSTPTEAWDFGLGYGARGQGAGDYRNPSGEGDGTKGVWGPHSGLPGAPPQPSGAALAPAVDRALNERGSQSLLPQDAAGPAARSDYYRGPKDNLLRGESQLPGDGSVAPWEQGLPVDIDTGYVYEDLSTPYVRNDYTRNERPKRDQPDIELWAPAVEVS